MFGFIKRLLGAPAPAPSNVDPFGRQAQNQRAVRNVPPEQPALPAAVLQRDEILDAHSRIAGYRFSARLPESAATPDAAATVAVLGTANVAQFAERRLALIPLHAADWFAHDYASLIGPHTVFLLDLPAAEGELAETWLRAATEIRGKGARVALSGRALAECPDAVSKADLLLIDFHGYSLSGFEQQIKLLRQRWPEVNMLIEGLGRWAEFRYCLAQGAAFGLGAFTTEADDESENKEISQSRLVLIELLNLLRREADVDELALVAKRDPGVVVKVVAMANSPVMGLAQSVTSIEQAMLVLGREQLYRWVSIGMFRSGANSPRDEVLLELALARGRFLEYLGSDGKNKAECDELFLLGLLSLLDSLLGVPMAAVVERIHLSAALREALLDSGGPLGPYLALAIAVEKGHVENVARYAQRLGYALPQVETATMAALAWADEAVRYNG